MKNLSSLFASVAIILLAINIKLSFGLTCYNCKEIENKKCGATLLDPLSISTVTCFETCVTFKNKYDGGSE